jgi:putative pyruvate formate lyase activating enzyme
VNRLAGERGACRLGSEAVVGSHSVHIGEEPPINPTLAVSLAGCGLRCRYCQQGLLLDPDRVPRPVLGPDLWQQLTPDGARTLMFIGGNPDESLPAILRFLRAAPEHWTLPIVWKCHAYATPEALLLLRSVADVYVPDVKYGTASCGTRWSGVPDYPARAAAALRAMIATGALVIARILVLPGHLTCCHLPMLDLLASLPQPQLLVSVRGQYCPDWEITAADGPMAARPSPSEVQAVIEAAEARGLTLTGDRHPPRETRMECSVSTPTAVR